VNTVIKTTIKALSIPLVLLLIFSGTVMAAEDNITIQVSPNVINLSSNGGSFSIHAEIGYSLVEDQSLEVNGTPVAIFDTFADYRGELVVKCNIDTVKDLLDTGDATFVLTVYTTDAEYTGTDIIRVIDCGK